MNKPLDETATISRAEIEDFLFREADLLDSWKLDDWLGLMTDDAAYYVPPNDKPDGDHRQALESRLEANSAAAIAADSVVRSPVAVGRRAC